MSQATSAATAPAGSFLSLDPFAYCAGSASRIAGLGGGTPHDDPAYGFHTDYVAAAPGTVRVELKFTGLTAETGTLTLAVNGVLQIGAPQARLVKSWSFPLAEIARGDGVVEVGFTAKPDTLYAVLGHVRDETDARASDLQIAMEVGDLSPLYRRRLDAARKSVFGRRLFRRPNPLVDERPATLADPVSQTCTSAQCDEPDYLRWVERLRIPRLRHRKQWEFVYVLRALEQHGKLRPGSRGLGFGVGHEQLPSMMASMGCTVVGTDLDNEDARAKGWSDGHQHLASLWQLHYPELVSKDVFAERVSYRAADMNDIDADLRNFDFTWSACALEHLGSIRAGLDFIRNSIDCLKPGGVAVHTTELNLVSNDDTIDNQGTVLFRRRDMEELAADLIARGHWVAPFRYDLGSEPMDQYVDVAPYIADVHLKLTLGRFVTTSFGIIVRRGEA